LIVHFVNEKVYEVKIVF